MTHEEYDYKELPSYGGNALYQKAEKLEREGWEFLEYRGSRIIYRRKKGQQYDS